MEKTFLIPCKQAVEDMAFYFTSKTGTVEDGKFIQNKKAEAALQRAIEHMTAGSTAEHHNIACQGCWDRYMALKRAYCGG